MLHHEKLDVYQCSVEFLALSSRLIEKVPRGHSALADQLEACRFIDATEYRRGGGQDYGS